MAELIKFVLLQEGLNVDKSRYDKRMKSKLDPTTTPEQKMQRFQIALGRVLQVSHEDMKQALVEDKKVRRLRKGKPGPKPSSTLGHASDSET